MLSIMKLLDAAKQQLCQTMTLSAVLSLLAIARGIRFRMVHIEIRRFSLIVLDSFIEEDIKKELIVNCSLHSCRKKKL